MDSIDLQRRETHMGKQRDPSSFLKWQYGTELSLRLTKPCFFSFDFSSLFDFSLFAQIYGIRKISCCLYSAP